MDDGIDGYFGINRLQSRLHPILWPRAQIDTNVRLTVVLSVTHRRIWAASVMGALGRRLCRTRRNDVNEQMRQLERLIRGFLKTAK